MVADEYIDELRWLIEVTSEAIRKTYNKDVVIFEHGNCSCLGGLDRAHLHLMAINKNIDDDLISEGNYTNGKKDGLF